MKRIVSIIVITALFMIVQTNVQAADFNIVCDNSSCTPGVVTNFFDAGVIWYPTLSQTQKATISNTSSSSQYIGHGARNVTVSPGANIAAVLDLVVRRQSDNAIVWSGTIQDLYDGNEVGLGTLGLGETETYIYTITMRDVGNEYQGKSTQFDMDFGYYIPTPTPSPTLTPTPTQNSNSSTTTSTSSSTNSSGEGGGDGGGTSEVFGIAADSPFSRFVSNVFGIFDSGTSSGEILAEDIQEAEDADDLEETTVLGEQDEICQNASWWWIVILGYGLTSIILLVLGSKLSRIFRVGIHGTATLAAIILLIYALCSWYIAATLVLVLGLASYFLLEGQAQDE